MTHPEPFWSLVAWGLVVFLVGLEWPLGQALEWWKRPRKEESPWK